MQRQVDELEKLLHNLSYEETQQLNGLLDKLRAGNTENLVEEPEVELLSQQEKF
jgi:hypothetical protein